MRNRDPGSLRLVTVLGAAALCAASCVSREPPPAPRVEAVAARSLTVGDELAGQGIAESIEGPWRMRTTTSSAGALREMGRLDAAEEALGGPTTGGGAGGAFAPRGGALVRTRDEVASVDRSELSFVAARETLDSGIATAAGGGGDGGSTRGPAGEVPGAASAAVSAVRPAGAPALPPATPAGGYEDADGAVVKDAKVAEFEKAYEGGAPPARALRAGATDDNEAYGAYLEFLATWVERKEIRELYQPLDVSDRHLIRVVDAQGDPVPGAVVTVVDEIADRVLFSGTTYGDGRVPYYPHLTGSEESTAAGAGDGPSALLVEALVRDAEGNVRGVRAPWDGVGEEIEVALDDVVPLPGPVRLDVCFVIDTTGSMADEIESIKASLLRVTEQLRGLEREFDLRYGAVLYRDIGDDYVTATHAFTGDIEAFDRALRAVTANGGGDGPESLNQAVAEAVQGVDWREDAAKVAFLIADAPPHMDYAGDVPYGEGARAALARGIRIHAVAAGGLDPVGTLVFRQIAQLTRGKFIFIEYGTPEQSAASHGVEGAVKRDNLEDILFRQIRDEVAHYGR